MKSENTYTYIRSLGKAAYILKRERFETLLWVKDNLELAEKILDNIMDYRDEEEYVHLEKKVKRIKDVVNEKFKDL